MAEVKLKGLPGKLSKNYLTEREDDYTFNVTYTANRSIADICALAANEKYSASELKAVYDLLLATAKNELYNGATVEFGFSNNSLGVSGPFIGPKAQFDPTVNRIDLRTSPRTAEYGAELQRIPVIVTGVEEGLPTIISVTDVRSGATNDVLTPGGIVNVKVSRGRITDDSESGLFFIADDGTTAATVPVRELGTNMPTKLSFVVPQLATGKYYLKIVTCYSGNDQRPLKEPRENTFPYQLTVK